MREFYTLQTTDVGRPTIRAFGRLWPVSDFIGRVLPQDVGKRVFRRRAESRGDPMTQSDAIIAALRANGYDVQETAAGSHYITGWDCQSDDDYTEARQDVVSVIASLGGQAEWVDDDLHVTAAGTPTAHDSQILTVESDEQFKARTLREQTELANDVIAEVIREEELLDTLVQALKLAEATIDRLKRTDSANGTLDVIRTALDKAEGK